MKETKFEYKIKEEDKELRIRELLRRNYNFSSRLIRRLKVQGGVCLNGEEVKLHVKGRPGDVLTCSMPQETSHFEPEDIPIDVVFEDSDLLLINKQPGHVVHPTKGHVTGTMANGIMKHMLDRGEEYKIRFVNRLDMDTSGLMIVAKNSHCQDDFSRQMAENTVVKRYCAVVKGEMPEEEGTIDLPIGQADTTQVGRCVLEGGFPSVTHFKVMERLPGHTVLELVLETGRTHQIRVHLSHIGYPIVGDALYGGETFTEEDRFMGRQALHAKSLTFIHPVTRKPVEASAALPSDMENLIKKLKES